MKRIKYLICLLAVCALLAAPVMITTCYAQETDTPPVAAQNETDGQTPDDAETPPTDEETPPEEDKEGIISSVLSELRSGWDLYVVPMIASVSSSAFVFTIAGFVINLVSKKRNKKQSEIIQSISDLLVGDEGLTGKIKTIGSALVELSERHNATDAEVKAIRDTEETLRQSVVMVNDAIGKLGAQNKAQLKLMDMAWTNSEGLNEDTKQTMRSIIYGAENPAQETHNENAG